ncbi:hypothetical protein J3458_014527 [Metarhizium acridum]|uniref:uncharacterized protein n=1 Tax=Metarhizium acridum TaxID=92637 RepID=UPI001C6ADA9C|nr:hypothetical protein J3458_014527 [Metarhizium acridum]
MQSATGEDRPRKVAKSKSAYDSTFTMRPHPHMHTTHHPTSKPKVLRGCWIANALTTTTNRLAFKSQQGTNRCWGETRGRAMMMALIRRCPNKYGDPGVRRVWVELPKGHVPR